MLRRGDLKYVPVPNHISLTFLAIYIGLTVLAFFLGAWGLSLRVFELAPVSCIPTTCCHSSTNALDALRPVYSLMIENPTYLLNYAAQDLFYALVSRALLISFKTIPFFEPVNWAPAAIK